MHRAVVLVISLILQAPSSAHSASLDDDIRRLADLAKAGVNVRVESYDVKSFSIKRAVEQMRPRLSAIDRQCDMQPVLGRDDVVLNVALFDAFIDNGDEVEALVGKLNRQKRFLGATGYYWDGLSGEETDCSEEYLSMHFSNGKSLIIENDY